MISSHGPLPHAHAICFDRTGGPEVLQWTEVDVADPEPDEVLVRHTAVGLNFVDTYFRSGLYPARLPSGLGMEAAGVVEAVGDDVEGLAVGDRVAYGTGPLGAYSELATRPARDLVRVPDEVDDQTAAAIMLKGLTVQYLLRQTHDVGTRHRAAQPRRGPAASASSSGSGPRRSAPR